MDGPILPFGICGRHPTVFAVELPPWLPHDTMEKMIIRFERFLRDQIFTMIVHQAKERHIDSDSEQDTSSTGSLLDGCWEGLLDD